MCGLRRPKADAGHTYLTEAHAESAWFGVRVGVFALEVKLDFFKVLNNCL
jgi:hypothetical protein